MTNHVILFVCPTNWKQRSPAGYVLTFFFETLKHLTLLRLVRSVTQLSHTKTGHFRPLLSIYFAFDRDFAYTQLKAPEPVLSCGTRRGGTAKSRVLRGVLAEVILVTYSSIEITTLSGTIVAVYMERKHRAVTNQDGAVEACVSTDIDKLGQKTELTLSRFLKQIQVFQWHAYVIPIVNAIRGKIASGPPVSWNILDRLHTGHRQAVVVPLRDILVSRHVV